MKFRIPIGDWSGDGHDRVEWFIASTPSTIKKVRAAYFKARKKVPKELQPESFCAEFDGEGIISLELMDKIKKLSGVTIGDVEGAFGEAEFCIVRTKNMAEYVVWFINHGDPTVKVKLDKPILEMLPFYSFNGETKRHIGPIGYGLFYE